MILGRLGTNALGSAVFTWRVLIGEAVLYSQLSGDRCDRTAQLFRQVCCHGRN
jgi:hypothetical protein